MQKQEPKSRPSELIMNSISLDMKAKINYCEEASYSSRHHPQVDSCRDIPSKVKDKSVYLAPLTIKKEAQGLVSLFGFCRQYIPHLGMLLRPIYPATWKAPSFVWGLEQATALQQVQGVVQVALPLTWTI